MATQSFIKDPIPTDSEQPIYSVTIDDSLLIPLLSEQIYAIQNRGSFLVYFSFVGVGNIDFLRNPDTSINYEDWHELRSGEFVIVRQPQYDAVTGEHIVVTRELTSFGRIHLAITQNT